jgi:tetratricopeptide (TPR) repeat protein
MNHRFFLCLALVTIGQTGCHRDPPTNSAPSIEAFQSNAQTNGLSIASLSLEPCALILAPQRGSVGMDHDIAQTQQEIRGARLPAEISRALERLGWLYAKKARTTFDPGFYKLAEQCAICLESKSPASPEALFLRGYALQNLHRFKEAELIARQLTSQRGQPFDFGLLGDVLVDLGRLDEAMVAYQKMMDLKPDAHAYTRAAHLCWMTGNVIGAIELLEVAAMATSPHDSETAAWIWTKLGQLHFQNTAMEEARRACTMALQFQKDYPPALLLQGRMLLAEGLIADAAESLRLAARLNPLPEYEWTLAEALRAACSVKEAEQIESRVRSRGMGDDPRTVALLLATRGEQPERALQLAQAELQQREDVFSHDALAWAFAANGQFDQAHRHMAKAMAHGTEDGRLFFHAAVIASRSGDTDEAQQWLTKADKLKHLLLPSELSQLELIRAGDGRIAPSSGQLSASLEDFSAARK